MNRTLKWIIAVVLAGGAIVALSFAFMEGREEIAREREREAPIKVAPRISRNAEGDVVITLDAETQKRIALETATLIAYTVRPEVAAYGRVLEDPEAAFVVRAPIAGILRASPGRNWPSIGETVPDGVSIGTIEPRLAPIERVDLVTRISDARADVEAAEARVNAARAGFERARILNADNKNVSDRALQEAEASLKVEEARLAAARQAAGTTPMPLPVARGGEVVEILARPNETIESGQPILRVARFDRLLVRVDVPAGEAVDRSLTMARIVAVGQEDRPFTGQRVSVASTVDPSTLGQGFLFRVAGASPSLRPGAAVVAYLQAPGAAQHGVSIPYSAIVRSGGKTWVFQQLEPGRFSRREVAVDHTIDRGVLVSEGLKPGDRIVVEGAQLLLSEEQKPQIQVGEEAEQR